MKLRNSLVVRTTLQVMGIALVLGFVSLGFGGGTLARRWERARQQEALEALLDVVAPSASAACFADDGVLADQVVRGLIGTPSVQGARIRAGDRVLAEASRTVPAPGAASLTRSLQSPFAPESVLGELVLFPDPGEARRQGAHAAGLFRTWSLGILAILAGGLALTVHQVIIAPITALTRELHALQAGAGGRLATPKGHHRDELGQLVGDVNALLERMVEAMWKEQALGQRQLQDGRLVQAPGGDVGANLIVVRGDGGLEAWTPGVQRLLGQEPLPGAPVPTLFGTQAGRVGEALDRCRASGSALATLRMPDPAGPGHRWLHLTLDRIGPGWCQGLLADVTSYLDAPAAGGGLEVKDPVTGALNRLGAEHALEERFASGTRGPGLLLLALDGLERAPGGRDEILRQAAQRLAAGTRRWDLLAHLGDATFLVILDRLEDTEAGMKRAQALVERLGIPFPLAAGGEARITASAGLTLRRPGEGPSRQALLERAGTALAEAQRNGGGLCLLD
ncbi:diguanylate cyclase domain-containing protein [Geothrix sp. 21YS21S-2]|uniref:diguanylate cyclase domain-containing protein n=1 Tax=Geothrix sp. 21YS21S-2 TaxID=3068893 RepID=UPI0027BA52CB|nr:diguanylate cyclase [Geothrix sp. 21YS21S-2]